MSDKKKTGRNMTDAPDKAPQSLDPDALEMVSGATNPFEDMPRVPAKDIDERLRVAGR